MPGYVRRRRRGVIGLVELGAAALGAAAVAVSIPTAVSAQAPDEPWRTLATEHFRITFPEHLDPLARRAADRAEWAYDALAEALIDPPEGLIDVLVTDHTDGSNGFAQVVPSNRITVFARPPVDLLSLGYFDDWMELVILHELAHIVHLDYTRNPIGRLARAVFGRVHAEWPFFPALGTPRWLIEGLATWYESRLTGAGRVAGTFQEMQMRTALIEGRFENIGQASGASPVWPAGHRPFAADPDRPDLAEAPPAVGGDELGIAYPQCAPAVGVVGAHEPGFVVPALARVLVAVERDHDAAS